MISKLILFVILLAAASFAAPGPVAVRSSHVFKRVGGLEIKADVHRLGDHSPRPVIVFIHGGGLINGSRDRINPHLQQLINEGLVVVSIDYRLAPETKLPAIIEDVEDAFNWVRSRGPELFDADANHIGVWGESAGGYLTLMAGFRVQPAPQVLVSAYGYGDLIGEWYSTPSPHARHRASKLSEAEARAQVSGSPIARGGDRKGNGSAFYLFCRQRGIWPTEVSPGWDPVRDAAKFAPFMPVKNVTAKYPPTFLLHGTADTDVPYEQSVMMAAEFKKHGVPHEFATLQKGEHGLGGADPALVEQAYQDAIKFVKHHLGIR